MKRNSTSLVLALSVVALAGVASANDTGMPENAIAEAGTESLLDLRHVIEEYPFPVRVRGYDD